MNVRTRLLSGFLLASGSIAAAQISGSVHDFRGQTWNPNGQICEACHTPHKATVSVAGLPGLLWNHELTSATFQMYTSITLDGAIDPQPGSTSLMCLSCHDGTVGLGDFGGSTGTPTMTGPNMVGTDLRGEHPISIIYDPVAEPNLHATSNTLGGSQTILSVLEGGKVECSSCHDVHNSAAEVFDLYLLRDTRAGSQLCLDCHNI